MGMGYYLQANAGKAANRSSPYETGKSGAGKGKGGKEGKSGKSGKGPAGPKFKEELGEFAGTIKSFSEKNGYGFIDCPDLKSAGYNDVFVHHLQMAGKSVGDNVTFKAFLNEKDQPQAD